MKKEDIQISKDLVILAVEKALLSMGEPELKKVETKLKNEYNCYIEDCLDHPEFLRDVLCELFGNCYNDILESIENFIKTLSLNPKLENFIVVLRSGK